MAANASPPSTFIAYIDESGDEGFSFGMGSSEWFVLSAVILRKQTELATVKLVDEVRTVLGKPPKKPLHFRDLKHHHRLPYLERIASADLTTVCVLAHKPSLTNQSTFATKDRLYFYLTKYLLERISWYCRDALGATDVGDGCVEIVFSNRASMSYEEFRDYLRLLEELGPNLANCSIDWKVTRTNRIVTRAPGSRMGLQIADAVAGAFYHGVEPTPYGQIEDRYARILRPVVYGPSGRLFSYGLKFWPRSAGVAAQQDARLKWLDDYR